MGSGEFELEMLSGNADKNLLWTARPTYVHLHYCC